MVGTGDRLKTEALEVILEATAGSATIAQTIYSRPMAPQAAPMIHTSGSGLLDSIADATLFN